MLWQPQQVSTVSDSSSMNRGGILIGMIGSKTTEHSSWSNKINAFTQRELAILVGNGVTRLGFVDQLVHHEQSPDTDLSR